MMVVIIEVKKEDSKEKSGEVFGSYFFRLRKV
jgi:hypothetical protein